MTATPDEVKARAKGLIDKHKAMGRESPWYRAYFDRTNPAHQEAVTLVAQLQFLSEHGRIEIVDDDGNPTLHPLFQGKSEFEELAREGQSAELAKRGIKMPDMQVAEDSGDGGGERSLEDLRNDPEFMDRYMNGWAEGHDEAVAEYTAAFRADQSGGTADGDED